MNYLRIALAGLAGTAAYFALGGLLFGLREAWGLSQTGHNLANYRVLDFAKRSSWGRPCNGATRCVSRCSL